MIVKTAFRSIALAAAASAAAQAGKPIAGPLTVGADQIVAGTIGGQPARYHLLADGSSTLILNPQAAQRLGMKAGWFGVGVMIGPVMVNGSSAVVRYAVAGQPIKRRIGWFDRPVTTGADGALGPSAVPQPIVTFQLRAPATGETTYSLPLTDLGYRGLGTNLIVGGQTIFVQWDLTQPAATGTAAAGADLAASHGARFTGPAWQEPIRFGVKRPVRRLALATPLTIGPIAITQVVTRVSDYGDTSAIADADADQSEIVVAAKGRKSRAIHSLRIGRDAMAGCSSISFDKSRSTITLSCRAG